MTDNTERRCDMIPADSFDAETDTGGRAGECPIPKDFAARLAKVSEKFGGKALPPGWSLQLETFGPQEHLYDPETPHWYAYAYCMDATGWGKIDKAIEIAEAEDQRLRWHAPGGPMDDATAARAWAGWLVERLPLYVSISLGPGPERVLVEYRPGSVVPRFARAPTLDGACRALLEDWIGKSPFEETTS